MTNEELEKLDDEVKWGQHARSAYDNYLKHIFDQQNEYAITQFKAIDARKTEDLLVLKYLIDSISTIENAVLSDISTGKMALKQLEQVRNNG